LSLVVITVESNVAGFTIGGRPGIANQPEALAILATVADQDYDVVQIRLSLVAAVENTAIISMPVAGVDSDCKRTDLGERVHYLAVAVFSKLNKAWNFNFWDLVLRSGALALNTVVGGVRVLELFEHTFTVGEVVESDLSRATKTVARTTALIRVESTTSDLLGREVKKQASVDGGIRLNSRCGGESPAWATVALVLNSWDDALGAPVNLAGKFAHWQELNVIREIFLRLKLHRHPLNVPKRWIFLGSSQVTHMVDVLFPASARQVVSNHAFKLFGEYRETGRVVLSAVFDVQVVVVNVLLEGVVA
jgi:hypothetical protein